MIRFDVWTKGRKIEATTMVVTSIREAMDKTTPYGIGGVAVTMAILSAVPTQLITIRNKPFIEAQIWSYRFNYSKPFSFSFYRFKMLSVNYGKPREVKLER